MCRGGLVVADSLVLSPQQTTWPLVFTPQLWVVPALTCRKSPIAGTGAGIGVRDAVGWTGGSVEIIVGRSGVTEGVGQAAATAAVMVAPRSGVGWTGGSGGVLVVSNK